MKKQNQKSMRTNKGYTEKNFKKTTRFTNPTVQAIVQQPPSQTDPNGSYTGKPIYSNETPQQDADDL